MACPDCGSSFGECRIASTVETHGLDCGPYERFDQEYVVCRECGGRFDIGDWDGGPERLFDVPEPAVDAIVLHVEQICPAIPGRPLAVMDNASAPLVRCITPEQISGAKAGVELGE